jgi:hypothetical protein
MSLAIMPISANAVPSGLEIRDRNAPSRPRAARLNEPADFPVPIAACIVEVVFGVLQSCGDEAMAGQVDRKVVMTKIRAAVSVRDHPWPRAVMAAPDPLPSGLG